MVIMFFKNGYDPSKWDVNGILGATGLWSCNHDSKSEALASLRNKAQKVADGTGFDVYRREAMAILDSCAMLEAVDESRWPVKGGVQWPMINYHKV
jgi:hypothetical protein